MGSGSSPDRTRRIATGPGAVATPFLSSLLEDNCFGHKDHIVTTMVGTERIPVICGKPGAAPARTLAEARAMASKWAVYTQCLMLGQKPGFSE